MPLRRLAPPSRRGQRKPHGERTPAAAVVGDRRPQRRTQTGVRARELLEALHTTAGLESRQSRHQRRTGGVEEGRKRRAPRRVRQILDRRRIAPAAACHDAAHRLRRSPELGRHAGQIGSRDKLGHARPAPRSVEQRMPEIGETAAERKRGLGRRRVGGRGLLVGGQPRSPRTPATPTARAAGLRVRAR